MPRKNSQNWTSGQAITADRLNNFNQDIDDIYSQGSDRMRIYRLSTDPALQVRIGAGAWRVGESEGLYNGGVMTVTDNATTLVMIDLYGNFQTSTSAWNPQYAKVGMVVASGGVITNIVLTKNDVVGGLLSGKGIPDMRDSAIETPISYANQTMYGPEFRPQSGGAGALNIPGGVNSWYIVITYGSWKDAGGGQYTKQIAYGTQNGDTIWMRNGESDTTWGAWKKVFPLDARYLEIQNVGEGGALSNYDFFLFQNYATGATQKKAFLGLFWEVIKKMGIANSQSYYAASYGWTSPANHFPNGGIMTAQISGIYNSGYAHPNPIIQISTDLSNWSTLMTLVPGNTGNPVGTCIVPPGYYARYTSGNNGYDAGHSVTAQIF